jgi:hypothetical protein
MSKDAVGRPGWRERRKDAKRAKAERTGDTPEKGRERPAPDELRTVEENAKQAGIGGFNAGGF